MPRHLSLFIQLIRPHQWIKNFFVAAPLFFGGALSRVDLLINTLVAFFAFCLVSSAVYCLNDWLDIPSDQLHPVKRYRPLASGKISRFQGLALLVVLLVLGLLWVALLLPSLSLPLLGVLGGYFVMNVFYSLWLKRWAIVDVFVIALGFVLRVYAGGIATAIVPSRWLLLMTFLLTLFMAFAKRRDDVLIWQRTGEKMRPSISQYNLTFLDHTITILATTLLVAYLLYTLSDEVVQRLGEGNLLFVTFVFVLYTLLRYLQLTFVCEKSGSPTQLFWKDRGLQWGSIGWIISFAVILYIV